MLPLGPPKGPSKVPLMTLQLLDFCLSILTLCSTYMQVPTYLNFKSMNHMVSVGGRPDHILAVQLGARCPPHAGKQSWLEAEFPGGGDDEDSGVSDVPGEQLSDRTSRVKGGQVTMSRTTSCPAL